jgi:hypothetical protein
MSLYAPEDLSFPEDIVNAIINNRLTPEVLELMKKLFGGGDYGRAVMA